MTRRYAGLAAVFALTCAEAPTEIVVRLFPQASFNDGLISITVGFAREGGAEAVSRVVGVASLPPYEFGIVARNPDDARRVIVTVDANYVNSQVFHPMVFNVAFTRGEITTLDIPLADRCTTAVSPCGPSENCTFLGCAPQRIETLPRFVVGGLPSSEACPLLCGSRCYDPRSNPSHCGRCGNPCEESQVCNNSVCGCRASETLCDGQCFDREDAQHCGGCSVRCAVACRSARCTTAASVSVGETHACATLSDGSVSCWGNDLPLRLGLLGPFRAVVNVPLPTEGAAVTRVSAGAQHTCALQGTSLVCWGANDNRQLGRDTPAGYQPPGRVAFDGPFGGVSVGGSFTCALRAGRVFCFGSNVTGQIAQGLFSETASGEIDGFLTATTVVCGAGHACALTDTGEVWCWGSNGHGQCGATQSVTSPVHRVMLPPATAITAGGDHTCAIVSGRVWCWGDNSTGALGDGTTLGHPTPVSPPELASETARMIAAGSRHTCAVTNTEGIGVHVFCWGANASLQLGVELFGDPVLAVSPVLLMDSGVIAPRDIAAGARATCVLEGDGRVICWGEGIERPGLPRARYFPHLVRW